MKIITSYYEYNRLLLFRIVRTENLQRYGEIILHCTVNITHGIREYGNSMVLKCVCALLNSGGGILHMKNIDIQVGHQLGAYSLGSLHCPLSTETTWNDIFSKSAW